MKIFKPFIKKCLLIFPLCCFLLSSCEAIFPKPFDARVMAVFKNMSNDGYSIVLCSTSDPNVWVAASVEEIVKKYDTLTVDKAAGTISYNGEIKGRIINRR